MEINQIQEEEGVEDFFPEKKLTFHQIVKMNEEERTKQFRRVLLEYLCSKRISTLKIPQVGGKELNFQKLYGAVTRRGGFNKVNSDKQWKEIAKELDLGPTCTSSTFTLRNHYKNLLLDYELENFDVQNIEKMPEKMEGGKEGKNCVSIDDSQRISSIPQESVKVDKENEESSGVRGDSQIVNIPPEPFTMQDQSIPQLDPLSSQPISSLPTISDIQKNEQPKKEKQLNMIKRGHTFKSKKRVKQAIQKDLKQNVNQSVVPQQKENKNVSASQPKVNTKEVYYASSKDIGFVNQGEMRRIELAFKSEIPEEIQFALNRLLLVSISDQMRLSKQRFKQILDSIVKYIEVNIRNIFSLQMYDLPFFSSPQILNIFSNYNLPVSEILCYNSMSCISSRYSQSPIIQNRLGSISQGNIVPKCRTGEVHLLQQMRQVFLIIRNFCFECQEEIGRNDQLLKLASSIFLKNKDKILVEYSLDILDCVSSFLRIEHIKCRYDLGQVFCIKLFELLYSIEADVVKSALNIISNFIFINNNIFMQIAVNHLTILSQILAFKEECIQSLVLIILQVLSDSDFSIREILAQHSKILSVLISVLLSTVQCPEDNQIIQDKIGIRIGQKISTILMNLSVPKSTIQFFKPFERSIAIVVFSQTDEILANNLYPLLNKLSQEQEVH